jgi:hypothetical protein
MTRLKNFLLEEFDPIGRRTKVISFEDAKNIIETKCTDVLNFYRKSNTYIYRGTSSGNILHLDTRGKEERESRSIQNYYTLIINNDPSWKKFPKRQIICSTWMAAYGKISYLVFPINGSKIGICSKNDIWYSFDRIMSMRDRSVSLFFDELDRCFKKYANMNVKTYNDLKKACGIVDNKLNDYKEVIFEFINYDEFKKYGMFNTLLNIFSPKSFDVVSTKTLNKLKEKREVWMDTECILINVGMVDLFYELGMENANEINKLP